jgi:FRG domain
MPSRPHGVRRVARATPKQPFDTFEIRDLSGLMTLAKNKKFEEFATIFRGQPEDFALVPKIGRRQFRQKEAVSIRPGNVTTDWYVDPAQTGLQWIEESMLKQFERMAPSFTLSLPHDRWEVLALAQHHGLPTRLLDWTF